MLRRLFSNIFNPDKIAKKLLSPEKYAKRIGVKVGKNCFIFTKNFSGEPFLITIGDNVKIIKGVSFYTHAPMWVSHDEYPNLDYFGKISIGNNCFIGADAKLMPGVIIEDNCIVGAGAVVTKSVPKGSIVAGNPAVYIGKSADFVEKVKRLKCETKGLKKKDKIKKLLSLSDNHFIQKEFLKTFYN